MPAKLTQELFIEKAIKKHNGFYNYSLVKYINANTKVKIICPNHGEFDQQPNNHLFGQGCIRCMGDNVRKARKLTHHDFIKKLKNKQPELYELISFKEEYKLNSKKVLLQTKYGDVLMSPNQLLEGTKPCISNATHPEKYIMEYIKINNKEFYNKIIKIKTNYSGYNTPLLFDTIYGEINLTPDTIFRGNSFDIRSATNKIDFIYNYLKIHHPKYNNIQIISEFNGCMEPIEVKYKSKIYKTTTDALFRGVFSGEKNIGVKIKSILEKNKEKFKNEECFVYKIKLFNENETFYKIGISKNLKERFKIIPYNVEIIEIISSNKYDSYYIEQNYHNILKEFKYEPKTKFPGQTECFTKII
jgi:hypothetical protein